jgi:hypothetical protein
MVPVAMVVRAGDLYVGAVGAGEHRELGGSGVPLPRLPHAQASVGSSRWKENAHVHHTALRWRTVDANEVAVNGEAAKEPWFDRMLSKIYVRLAVARRGFITSGVGTAATNIDQHIDFNNINDAIAYIPRALQVSLFAPFPSQWFDFKNRNSSSAEIFLSSAEMIVAYICLAGWLYWLFSLKSISAFLLIPSLFCLSILLALGMSVANIGTIYRMRFPFEMVMISFGIAGWIKAIPFLRNFFLKRA